MKEWTVGDTDTMVFPANWKLANLGELGKFKKGKNITAAKMVEGPIPVISAGLAPSGYHNKANVHGESITISASGANAGHLMYHLSDIWAADCSYYQDKKNLWFVYNTLRYLESVLSNLQCGAAQPHVYPKNINKISIIIPDNQTMQLYCQQVEPIYQQIKTFKEMNNSLIKQRDLLLPRLMSGKLSVEPLLSETA